MALSAPDLIAGTNEIVLTSALPVHAGCSARQHRRRNARMGSSGGKAANTPYMFASVTESPFEVERIGYGQFADPRVARRLGYDL
jgi:hypothetical protein